MKGDTVSKLPREGIDDQCVYLKFSLRKLCLVTVILPVSSLIICFVTANIFQKDDIHETHCKVYNVVPSISAITGISPQKYLWRICVAFHVGPRLVIAIVYKQYYSKLLEKENLNGKNWLLNFCFWLSITEIVTLCGVTYISNRENYPIHEKIFITFMFSSLSYMLASLKIFNVVHVRKTNEENYSYKLKKLFFTASILTSFGLFIFFVKHRFLCHDMAFSWFSVCEYLIAFFNMGFHTTVILDFPTEQVTVSKGSERNKTNDVTIFKVD
ncbi:fgf receptor activating protein, putative [Pediculus humanus corporis]|uniref:Fgf receptor activating protein, putative n=1 Tax=Pediculus humanus subsp. corporis TaxID=121224 RepID=E0VDS0_PEDHC|nr:fgf receptor activating protein, putative [Pediculus humanus corporis]EEB11526.1 fgf receptor activating protein, putative [Pediculus humanus corporis]